MNKQEFRVDIEDNCRVDVFLSSKTDLTRSRIKKLCDEGLVFVNGAETKSSKTLKMGDLVKFSIPEAVICPLEPRDIPIEIVYQDKDLAVINKPQGLTVHEGNGTEGNTLVNSLLFHLDSLSGINGVVRPGIVHRIDKNTSGLLVVAKNDEAHLSLSKQIQDKVCKRIYVALLEGVLKNDSGTIVTFIDRDKKDRTKMAVSSSGRQAITDYKVLNRYKEYTLCEFSLQTGRTHQIRVHAKYLGHPIVGDPEYGFKNQKFKLDGQLLHAKKLSFIHPTSGKYMEFFAEMPSYFSKVLY